MAWGLWGLLYETGGNMNQRTLAMIHLMAATEKAFSLKELADEFGVSQRTIRNDINVINDLLTEGGLSELVVRKGIIRRGEDFGQLVASLTTQDYYSYKLSKEERKIAAAIMMINSPGFITLAMIADTLFVSRATIIGDLDDIKELMRESNLLVDSHPNKGLFVVGKESDKRALLFRLMAFRVPGTQDDTDERSILSIRAGDDSTIQKILNEQEHLHQSYMTDASFLKVRRFLGIMIDRILRGEYIEKQPDYESRRNEFARGILRLIAQYMDIHPSEDEVRYLCSVLDTCQYTGNKTFELEDVRIQMMTRQFIASISDILEINLDDDYDFFEVLSNHLKAMYLSSGEHFEENPMVREIVEEQPAVLSAVRRSLPILKDYNDRNIDEVELCYIVVHVCAAIERKKNSELVFRVVVACHAGIGTSQLLLEKLKKHFNFHIVDVVSSHEAVNIHPDMADFVISTIPLENCRLEHVVVSPLLNDEDYIRVGNKIDALRNSRHLPSRIEEQKYSVAELMDRIAPVVELHAPQQASVLIKSIRREIRQYFKQYESMENEILAPYLHQLLPASHIQIDVECSDWRDAIRKAAKPLEKMGYIEPRYIDAMITNAEENGPYFIFSKGFAVPHEGLEMGSIKVGMNLIRLKEPICFGADEFDPVDFVCCLSAIDHKTHLKAFFNLVNMLCNTDFYDALKAAASPEGMALVIEAYEYGLDR